MQVLVTGGTGFIGSALCPALAAAGHEVTVLSRTPASVARRTGLPSVRTVARLTDIGSDVPLDAVINLAGEPIADGRWTARRRARLRASRIDLTRELVDLCGRLQRPPRVLVSGSAIGWYGDGGDAVLDESSPRGTGFAADLCADWEAAAEPVSRLGIRLCLLRTGIVLHPAGGALGRMLLPFRAGLGGRIGSGRQWMSWIHRDDLVALVMHLLHGDGLSGPFNGTAPEPVTNGAFVGALAGALHRPAIMPVPASVLQMALGEAAGLLLDSQRVMPARALATGFRFRYPTLDTALADLLPRG